MTDCRACAWCLHTSSTECACVVSPELQDSKDFRLTAADEGSLQLELPSGGKAALAGGCTAGTGSGAGKRRLSSSLEQKHVPFQFNVHFPRRSSGQQMSFGKCLIPVAFPAMRRENAF